MGVRAIDVSVHQGPIDWPAVKASGVQAAWIKVGGADDGYYRDSRAGANLAGAEAVGLPFGTYYFCVPDRDPRRQAQHAVTCGYGRGVLWPSPDIETNPNGLSERERDQWAADFCDEIQRQIQRESVIYTNLATIGHTDATPRCPLWIANYGANRPGTTPPNFTPQVPPAWATWDIWQFNSTTRVPGIPQNTCDQNVISDAFWARMTNTAPAAHQEDDMINWRPVHCPEPPPIGTGDAQWMVTWDADARPRRLFLGPGDPAMFWGLGWLQNVEPIVKQGSEAAKFLALPEALPSNLEDLRKEIEEDLRHEHGDINEDELGRYVAHYLAERLAS